MSEKLRTAFRDTRTAADLLSAGRPPKSVSYNKKLSIPQSLRNKLAKVQNITKATANAVSDVTDASDGKQASKTADKLLLGATRFAAAATAASLFNLLNGKSAGAVLSVQKAASAVSLGARIIEETDPTKLTRPYEDGLSINKAQAAQSLAVTTASSILGSLINGVPLASGIPPQFKIFKTLAALKASPRLFDPSKVKTTTDPATDVTGNAAAFKPIGGPDDALVAQCGLLKDEIMYRLVLLAENVYTPIRDYVASMNFPPVKILEGFRAENTKNSPHERGEAIDITLGDGSLTNGSQLFDLAVWCRDHINYDQLILCFSDVAGGQAWIHISLSPSNNRRQVFTKPFNDVHREGLYHFNVYTDPVQLSSDQAYVDEQTSLAAAGITLLSARETLKQPIGVNTPEQSDGFNAWTDMDCGFVPPPPYTNTTPINYYWEPPVGVSLDAETIRTQIHDDILDSLGIDCYTEEGIQSLSVCDDGARFDIDYWIGVSQTPSSFSDGIWWVGWNGYYLSRIVNAVNNGDCASGDRGQLSSNNYIIGSDTWPTC